MMPADATNPHSRCGFLRPWLCYKNTHFNAAQPCLPEPCQGTGDAGIMEDRLMPPLKPLKKIVLFCTGSFRGSLNFSHDAERRYSLSLIGVVFSSLVQPQPGNSTAVRCALTPPIYGGQLPAPLKPIQHHSNSVPRG